MKLPFRPIPALISLVVVAALYWGLSQADSRSIYAPWDKWLHACVFFVIWWLGRWSLRLGSFVVTVLVILSGGAEEIHQLFQEGHVADWGDWLADIAGVSVALAIYVVGRLLCLLRESVEDARGDSGDRQAGVVSAEATPAEAVEPAQGEAPRHRHALDWRWNLKLWRWDYYVVLLAGHERRSLSRREQEIARWSVAFLIFVFLLVSTGIGALVVYLIKVALGV